MRVNTNESYFVFVAFLQGCWYLCVGVKHSRVTRKSENKHSFNGCCKQVNVQLGKIKCSLIVLEDVCVVLCEADPGGRAV
jgi:hypothetical protein